MKTFSTLTTYFQFVSILLTTGVLSAVHVGATYASLLAVRSAQLSSAGRVAALADAFLAADAALAAEGCAAARAAMDDASLPSPASLAQKERIFFPQTKAWLRVGEPPRKSKYWQYLI